jgi:hypothetical protein
MQRGTGWAALSKIGVFAARPGAFSSPNLVLSYGLLLVRRTSSLSGLNQSLYISFTFHHELTATRSPSESWVSLICRSYRGNTVFPMDGLKGSVISETKGGNYWVDGMIEGSARKFVYKDSVLRF